MSEILQNTSLNEREQSVLRHVVHNYIVTAVPVGSRYISRHFEQQLSAASIRNVMSDLEDLGFLKHPHTSAGRIPTDMGYRYYVDYLMEIQGLPAEAKDQIQKELDKTHDAGELLRESSKLLGKISSQLSVVSSPHFNSGVFEKLELIPVSSSKILVIISIRAGLVRTIMLEVHSEFRREVLEEVSQLLNERLTGLTLQQIRDSFPERIQDVRDHQTGLIRLFIDSVDQLFADNAEKEKVHISGTKSIIEQPEFVDPHNFRSVIELIENEEIIVHLLEKHDELDKDFVITIGKENQPETGAEYSVITATYDMNGATGRVGVIGPTRMNYSRVVPLVDYVAATIAKMLGS